MRDRGEGGAISKGSAAVVFAVVVVIIITERLLHALCPSPAFTFMIRV